jgi:DNA-damage-inducible protein J
MTLNLRTAILRARVSPEIKYAGEQVLRSIGLTMTEAMELFLRRVIVDQRLPFEVVALDEPALQSIVSAWRQREALLKSVDELSQLGRRNPRRPKKN